MARRWPRTIVFDLDDTLYLERDYLRSGLSAAARFAQSVAGCATIDLDLPEEDPLGAICARAGLDPNAKTALLWAYRLHIPAITLREGAREAIAACRDRGEAVCILTDGRSVSQRLKLTALALDHDAAFISEEIGAEKPDPLGYELIERAFPADGYVYVADNPHKDFIAANRRGWRTIGISAGADAIPRPCAAALPPHAMPQAWAASFGEVAALLHDTCAVKQQREDARHHHAGHDQRTRRA